MVLLVCIETNSNKDGLKEVVSELHARDLLLQTRSSRVYVHSDRHVAIIQYISAIEICNGKWRKGLGYKKVSGLVFPGGADRHYMKELEAKGGNVHIKEYVEIDGEI